MSNAGMRSFYISRRSPTPPETDRSSSVETEEYVEDWGRNALLLQSFKSDSTEVTVLTRRARLLVQHLFSKLQFLYHTGMLILFKKVLESHDWIIGILDASSATEVHRGIYLGGELAALQRRYIQFRQMVDSIVSSFYDTSVDVPTASTLSDDEFIYRGVIDDTSELAVFKHPKVFHSFPFRWNVGMRKIYMAMYACRPGERTVSQLSSWTCFTEAEVKVCLDCLAREGVVGGTLGSWRCV